MDLSVDAVTWNKLKIGEPALQEVEQDYVTSDRTQAFCEMLEALLQAPEELPEGVADAMRLRLVALYEQRLQEPERAAPHLEKLLAQDRVDDTAFDLAQSLLMRRSVAPRVAAALSDAYERLGLPAEELGPLTLELSLAAPPRLRHVKRRLAVLRQDVADDPEGALDLLAELLVEDPGDADVRARFVKLGRAGVSGELEALGAAESARPEELLRVVSEAVSKAEEEGVLDSGTVELFGFALELSSKHSIERLPAWLARAERVLRHAPPATRVEVFARAVDGLEPCFECIPLLVAAARAFTAAGAFESALSVYDSALGAQPGRPDLVFAVDELLAQSGEPLSERVQRLRAAIAASTEPLPRAELGFAKGQLERTEQALLQNAVRSFERALIDNPRHLASVQALVELAAEAFDTTALDAALERAAQIPGAARRDVLLIDTARSLCERGAVGPALELCRKLLAELTSDPIVLDAIETMAERENDLDLQRRALERRVEISTPGEESVAAYDRLGEFFAERLHDSAAAAHAWKAGARHAETLDDWGERSRRLYERALDSSHEDLEVAERLVWSYTETQDWAEVPGAFGILVRAREQSEELSRCVDLLLKLADRALQSRAAREFGLLVDEVLWRLSSPAAPGARALRLAKARVLGSDPAYADDAAQTFRALIEAHGEPDDVLEFRTFVERQPGADWRANELGWLFEWRAAHEPDPARPLLEWARLQEGEFGDPQAAEATYQRVHALAPGEVTALQELLRMRRQNDDPEGIESCLAELAARAEPALRQGLELERASVLIDRLDRADEGLLLLRRILEASPEHALARERFRALYRMNQDALSAESAELLLGQALELGDLELSIDGYRLALGAGVEPERVAELGARLLSFLDAHSTDAGARTAGFLAVLAAAPGTRWALDRVKLALNAEGRWQELFPLYDRAIAAIEDDDERAELLNEAAVAARDLMGDVERAIDYFVRLQDLRPDDARVDALLERLYERHDHTARLIDLLVRRAERVPDADQPPLRSRIASLMLDAGELEAALFQIDTLLSRSEAAQAEPLLERLFALPAARVSDPDQSSLAEAAASRLCDLFAAAERPDQVRRVLSEELGFVQAPARRLPLLRELSFLHEATPDQPEAAFEVTAELLAAEPGDEDAVARLGALAERLGWFERQVEVLLAAATSATSPELTAARLRAAAALCESKLSAPERAAALYDLLLDAVDEASPWVLDALRAQDSLWARLGRADRRCSGLERLAGLVPDASERRNLLAEAARLAEHEVCDLGRAADDWQAIVDENPEDREAVDGLISALAPGERVRPQQLAQALEHRIELSTDPAARRSDQKALARILANRLEARERAVQIWRDLASSDPADAQALDALVQSLVELQRYDEAASTLEAAARSAAAPERLYRKLAEIHRDLRGDVHAAIHALLAAPDLPGAAALAEQGELDDPALLLELASALIAAARAGEATGLLSKCIGSYGERRPRERSVAHFELSRALLALGRPAEALSELKTAVAIDPGNAELLHRLGELGIEHQDWDAAERSYRALLLVALHPTEGTARPSRAEIYVRLSHLSRLRNDLPRAEELIASAFEAAEDGPEERRALVAGLCRLGPDDLLLEALELPGSEAPTTEALSEIARECARRGPLTGPLAAWLGERVETLIDALSKIKPSRTNFEAWRPLLGILRLLGQKERLGQVLRTLASRFAKSAVGAELQIESLELMLDEADGREQAVDALLRLWERDPDQPRVAEILLRVLDEDGRLEELSAVLRSRAATAEKAGDHAGFVRLSLELAGVYERAGSPDRALDAYEAAARLPSAERRTALSAAARLAKSLGEPAERSAALLEALLELSAGPAAADTALELCKLYLERQDLDAAERVLVAGLIADPTRPELSDALVRLYLERGQHGNALDLLERALATRADDRALLLRYVGECEGAGTPERALAALGAALAHHPEDAELELVRSRVLRAAGRVEEALQVLDRLHRAGSLEHEPLLAALGESGVTASSRAWAFREIELLSRHGSAELARQRLSDWVAAHDDDLEALRELARLSRAARAWPQAIAAYEHLLELEEDASAVSTALSLADACERAGDPARCVTALERLWALHKPHAELRKRLERLYGTPGMADRLARLLLDDASAESVPAKRADLLARAAELYLEARAPSLALAPLEQALSLAPGKLPLALLSARALAAAGSPEEALARLEALARTPKALKASELAQVHERMAELLLERDELVEAFEALSQAHRLNRGNLRVAYLLGLTAVDLDDARTAASALRLVTAASRGASDITPRERSVAYHQLALIEHLRGADGSAQKLLQKALQEDPANAKASALSNSLQKPAKGRHDSAH